MTYHTPQHLMVGLSNGYITQSEDQDVNMVTYLCEICYVVIVQSTCILMHDYSPQLGISPGNVSSWVILC